ncbi:DUF4290 domain-containing protein [Pedobacter puniceum]|jgi:hypothetical protein|uniref:DUF4290 domain-containing protein n=1 Tax=Pedobacter puniceum TaxID=2666136 RepID=A0A7K0FMF4_9SPHI|nr:DUF4290 domain-containing protein [Pedobacter puniceum]MRX46430.1 DUF4290 domain-containing protein [Pedobacter puniceum]
MNNTVENKFDYNTSRDKLILAEYGRNVQNMVEYICELPTKEERNKYAQVVIDMMGFLNPHLRDVPDFKHKLWDHLHIISGFRIDVDSPYPTPTKEGINFKPEVLSYPQNRIKFKHYGKTIELMIKRAKEITEPEKKQHMVNSIANFMKMAYVLWNKDHVADEQIISDLNDLSGGELDLSQVVLNKVDVKQNTPSSNNNNNNGRSQKNNQNNRGGGGQRQNNNQNNNNKNRPRNFQNNGGGKRSN